jgi:flagellar hook-length control protein FliK
MLAQILMAPAEALAHLPAAPAAAVVTPVTDTPPADPNANAVDQPSSGDPNANPMAADPNAVVAAQMVMAQPAAPAAAIAAPTPPQPDAPAPAESTSAPAAAPDAGQPRPAAPIAQPAPIQPAETQTPEIQTAQSASTQPIDEVADAPAPDRPREEARPAVDASQTNAAPQPARHDALRPMDHIRAETRSIAVAPAVNQIAIHVSRAVKDGIDKFDIDLKPDTLGRVTVRLEFTSDTRVQAVFAAERPETLELLKRDAGEIARSLNDAGVRADAGSLSFNLHGNGNGNGGSAERQVAAGQSLLFPAADAIPAPAAIIRPNYVGVGGVDIRI